MYRRAAGLAGHLQTRKHTFTQHTKHKELKDERQIKKLAIRKIALVLMLSLAFLILTLIKVQRQDTRILLVAAVPPMSLYVFTTHITRYPRIHTANTSREGLAGCRVAQARVELQYGGKQKAKDQTRPPSPAAKRTSKDLRPHQHAAHSRPPSLPCLLSSPHRQGQDQHAVEAGEARGSTTGDIIDLLPPSLPHPHSRLFTHHQ